MLTCYDDDDLDYLPSHVTDILFTTTGYLTRSKEAACDGCQTYVLIPVHCLFAFGFGMARSVSLYSTAGLAAAVCETSQPARSWAH